MALLKDLIVLGPSRFIGDTLGSKFIVDGATSNLFLKGDGTLDSNTYLTLTNLNTNNPDLAAIEALSGTDGFLKKTATNTWSLDTTFYAPLDSPNLTGTPTAPTANSGTNTTQIATTEFVQQEIASNNALSSNYEMSSDSNSDLALEAGDTYEEAFGKIEKAINDNEIVIAASLGDLDSRISPEGVSNKAASIPYGVVDSTSTSTVFTATVDGITELKDGVCVLLRNSVVTSASGFTIDINNLGAHSAYSNMTSGTAETTIFNKDYTMLFVYDSKRVVNSITGAWCCYRGYNSNTDTIGYLVRSNSGTMNVSDTARYYKLYFTSADNTLWVPSSVDSTNNATSSRSVNQRPINPFGPIVYASASSKYTLGSALTATSIWQQYAITLGYAFNTTGAALTLISKAPVYVKCAPQNDGSAIIDSTEPIVLTLPSTEDGKIYIYLGIAYAATTIELRLEHPVYYYKAGGIRLWTGEEQRIAALELRIVALEAMLNNN